MTAIPRARRAHDLMIYLPSISGSLDPESSTGGGGAETQMLLLAQGLAALGTRVCMAAHDDGNGVPDAIGDVKLIRRKPYLAGRGAMGAPREAARIYATLAQADPDLVITRGPLPSMALLAWAARLHGRRFVYSSANVTDFEIERVERSRRNQALVRHAIRNAHRIVVQTDEQRALCEARYGRSCTVIRSVAAPAPAATAEPETFLWVGRMVFYKRPLAFVELARAVPEARFRMVCVPEPVDASRRLLTEVRRAAARLPNLELLGPLPRAELADLISRSVAIVNTADHEGMSNVLLEGWARGIPGIALSHDPDGLIERYGLGDFAGGSPERLAAVARALWAGRRDRRVLRERCRRYVHEHHAPEAVYQQWRETLALQRTVEAQEPMLVGA